VAGAQRRECHRGAEGVRAGNCQGLPPEQARLGAAHQGARARARRRR